MYLIQINLPPPSTISPLYTILRYIDTHPLLYAHKNVQEVPSLDTQTRPLFYNRVNLISRSFSVRICISDKDQLLMFYLLLKNLARLGNYMQGFLTKCLHKFSVRVLLIRSIQVFAVTVEQTSF